MNGDFSVYIRLREQIEENLPDWYADLSIRTESDGTCTIVGRLADQSALLGLLTRLNSLGICLLSVWYGAEKDSEHQAKSGSLS